LMESNFQGPINIGSQEMVSINRLAEMAMRIAGKQLRIKHIPGPLGVRGRNSDNGLIARELNWVPSAPLEQGLRSTYEWVDSQVQASLAVAGRGASFTFAEVSSQKLSRRVFHEEYTGRASPLGSSHKQSASIVTKDS